MRMMSSEPGGGWTTLHVGFTHDAGTGRGRARARGENRNDSGPSMGGRGAWAALAETWIEFLDSPVAYRVPWATVETGDYAGLEEWPGSRRTRSD